MLRHDIHFVSQGLTCRGWFYPAEGVQGKAPCIILAHGLGGIKECRLDAFAQNFASQKYHALVFDYRHFGTSDGLPRQILEIGKQLQDWHAAIRYAQIRPEVDADAIVLWGTSLSGGHVLKVAASEPQIKAVIAQVPHFDGIASLRAIPLPRMLRLTLHAMIDNARRLLGMSPHYVPAAVEPGELGLISGPGEAAGYRRLVPPNVSFDNRIAARIAQSIAFYSPSRALRRLRMPVLLQVALHDITTPIDPVFAAHKQAPNTQLKTYSCGHFDPYMDPMFSQFVDDQLAFLKASL